MLATCEWSEEAKELRSDVWAKVGSGQQRQPLKECVVIKAAAAVAQRLATLSCPEPPTATECCRNREQGSPADERSEIV